MTEVRPIELRPERPLNRATCLGIYTVIYRVTGIQAPEVLSPHDSVGMMAKLSPIPHCAAKSGGNFNIRHPEEALQINRKHPVLQPVTKEIRQMNVVNSADRMEVDL